MLKVQKGIVDHMIENLRRERDQAIDQINKSDLPDNVDCLKSDLGSDSEENRSNEAWSQNSSTERASIDSDTINLETVAGIHGIPIPVSEVFRIAKRYNLPSELFIRRRPKLRHRLSFVIRGSNETYPVKIVDTIKNDSSHGAYQENIPLLLSLMYALEDYQNIRS